MSPLNRGPLLGPRISPVGLRPPPPRFGGRLPGLPPRMLPPPRNPLFSPMRQRLPPPPVGAPRPLFGPRIIGMPPMVPPMGMRGPRGPLMRPWPRRPMPPQNMPPRMRPRFPLGNGNIKGQGLNNVKKVSKLEELELKKPWMTDEIRSEIQKKNKLYAKAKKNKDAKEWEEFKDLRNKVTRMIRDAKNDYLTKNSEQAHLYQSDEEPYDRRDENYTSAEDDETYYCEICDRDFPSEENLATHKKEHRLCGIDGCTFSAHPLLVQKHISMQHSTGLYHRLKNLSTPEDIEKWLAERKKKYPTKANIELKKAQDSEKIERGEIIKQKKDVAKHRRKKSASNRDKRRALQRRADQTFDNATAETQETYRGLRAFSGTLDRGEADGSSQVDVPKDEIDNEEDSQGPANYISDEEDLPASTPKPAVVTNPCSLSLVANYGSDSDDGGPEEVPIKKIKMEDQEYPTEEKKPAETTCTGKTNLETSKPQKHKYEKKRDIASNKRSKEKHENIALNRKRPSRPQLLQKLLSRSIQHERNLICQCVKYIVDNNFFD